MCRLWWSHVLWNAVVDASFSEPQSIGSIVLHRSMRSRISCCCGLSNNLTFFHGWHFHSTLLANTIHAFLHDHFRRYSIYVGYVCMPTMMLNEKQQRQHWQTKKSQFESNYSPSFSSAWISYSFFIPNIIPPYRCLSLCSNDEHLQLLTAKGGESVKK